jgi:hypothetical protein
MLGNRQIRSRHICIGLYLLLQGLCSKADSIQVIDTPFVQQDSFVQDTLVQMEVQNSSNDSSGNVSRSSGENKDPAAPLWSIGVGLILGLLYTLHRLFFRSRNPELNMDTERRIGFRTAHYLRVLIFSALTALLALPLFENVLIFGYTLEGWRLFGVLALASLLVFALKLSIYYILFTAIEQEALGLHLMRKITNGLFLISSFGYAIWMLVNFSPLALIQDHYLSILLVLAVLILAYRWWNVILLLLKEFSHSKVFIFFYFCGLEAIPVILLYHWWAK